MFHIIASYTIGIYLAGILLAVQGVSLLGTVPALGIGLILMGGYWWVKAGEVSQKVLGMEVELTQAKLDFIMLANGDAEIRATHSGALLERKISQDEMLEKYLNAED